MEAVHSVATSVAGGNPVTFIISSLPNLMKRLSRGFTLIELLLVIGIIAIIASIVIIAINPTRQLGQARDAQRRSDLNTILNAVYQYAIDHNGALPSSTDIPTAPDKKEICLAGESLSTCVRLDTLSGAYIVKVPNDPSITDLTTATGSKYFISKDANGRITVSGNAETAGVTISVTR